MNKKFEYAFLTISKFLVDTHPIFDNIEIEFFCYSINFQCKNISFFITTRSGSKREDYEAGSVRAFISSYEKNFHLEKSKRKKDLFMIDLFNYIGSHGWEIVGVIEEKENQKKFYLKREI